MISNTEMISNTTTTTTTTTAIASHTTTTTTSSIITISKELITPKDFKVSYYYKLKDHYSRGSMPKNDDMVIYNNYVYFVMLNNDFQDNHNISLCDDCTLYNGNPIICIKTVSNKLVGRFDIYYRERKQPIKKKNKYKKQVLSTSLALAIEEEKLIMKEDFISLLKLNKEVCREFLLYDENGKNPIRFKYLWFK
jgi:hypothetical protein